MYDTLLEQWLDLYKENYGTQQHYIDAYGGELKKSNMEIGLFGEMKIHFNRDVVYDLHTVS